MSDVIEQAVQTHARPPLPDGRINGFFSSRPTAIPWLVHERLVLGRGHVLTGVGGVSKTTLAYQLAKGVVLGRLPWAWPVQETGSAAIFATEDTVDDVHRRIHLLGIDHTQQDLDAMTRGLRIYPLAGHGLKLLRLSGQKLLEAEGLDYVMERLQLVPKPLRLVVFDPALGLTEGDELSAAHQRQLGELMDRIAIETGACVVLTSHAAKGINGLDEIGSHASRGSGALTDAVRGEFALRTMTADEGRRYGIEDRAERQRYVQLQATKGNFLPPDAYSPLWLVRGTGGLLQEAQLDQLDRRGVGRRETDALEVLKRACVTGDTTMAFWREQCVAAGLIASNLGNDARDKAMQRMRDALRDAGLVKPGSFRGAWVPA